MINFKPLNVLSKYTSVHYINNLYYVHYCVWKFVLINPFNNENYKVLFWTFSMIQFMSLVGLFFKINFSTRFMNIYILNFISCFILYLQFCNTVCSFRAEIIFRKRVFEIWIKVILPWTWYTRYTQMDKLITLCSIVARIIVRNKCEITRFTSFLSTRARVFFTDVSDLSQLKNYYLPTMANYIKIRLVLSGRSSLFQPQRDVFGSRKASQSLWSYIQIR